MTEDARGRLGDDPFDWFVTKSGELRVSRGGQLVQVLGGASAAKVIRALERTDDDGAQLVLARSTGHYRHGNERASGRR